MRLRRAAHRAYLAIRQRATLRILEELGRSQWLAPGAARALQSERLRALLAHAGAKVPFYRQAFRAAGLDPARLDGPEVLGALPVVTKETIRSRGREFLADDAERRSPMMNATGGSTGEPLVFYQDPVYHRHRQAVMYRGFQWCGWRVGGPLAYVWGSDVDSRSHRGAGALRDAIVGVTWVDAFTLEDRALDRVLDRIAAAAPEILIGYASSLRHLARRAAARGRPVRLRSVETSAELLTPEARREIEEAFGCRVLDRYGCREAGVIAHECGEGPGWHVNTETVHVDTDAEGRLLVTTLMNYTMPLVRYRNEDEVETAPAGERCPCGRGLPLIRRVVGRRSDIIRSPSGRAIHGEFFTHLFYGVPGVREFQVVQTTAEDLVIRVVADEAFTAGETERLARVVREHGDPRFRIRWERLAAIPRERSGKFRFTISELGDRPS